MLARDLRGLRPVMAKEDHINWDETRALQSSSQVIEANYAKLVRWGAYNIVKVMGRDDKPTVAASQRAPVRGYLTLLTAISGRTPLEMRDLLGLRTLDLRHGALVYRLSRLPEKSEIEVRGYTTLVDGAHLRDGIKQDQAGYRPGLGAYQVALKWGVEIEATLIATLGPNGPFQPGVHPDVAKLYPPGHPARSF